MKRWILAHCLLPVGVAVLAVVLILSDAIPNPVLYLRGNTALVALIAGVSLSAGMLLIFLFFSRVQKKHRDEITQVQKRADQDHRRFIRRLDHELKNPLTAIRAGLANLSSEPLGDYLTRELNAVGVQVLRISRLVTDLRKLALLETNLRERGDFDLAELLEYIVDDFKGQNEAANRHPILILPNAPWPLPDIEGDADLLLLAVNNLVENAVKYTSPGDTIEVRAFDDGNDVVVEVADTGPGIPEDEMERVWEELYRGEKVRGITGSGLGLPLVRVIIEQHGGMVGLRSRAEKGTVFSIRLPAKKTGSQSGCYRWVTRRA
jgi:two-component system OmpR family sensor kinase